MSKRRARGSLVAVALASLSLLASGCGGSKSPSVANVGSTTSTSAAGATDTTSGAASSGGGPTQAQLRQDLLKYSACMRAHGVPTFPDPSAGGGFEIQGGSGINPSSPTLMAAQAKCRKLLPNGGPPAAGSSTHPSVAWLAKMLKAAQCMRRHGITGFPDPTTTVPSLPAGGGVVSFIEGAVFVFPATLDTQSPLFKHAATTCGFPLENH